ncbi:MAG: hypothetical protein LUQ65_11690 [Candidatus Helarchaeota archaeon]|nr:hypothetical protein [Candidatus Helarchaeota archaeon]
MKQKGQGIAVVFLVFIFLIAFTLNPISYGTGQTYNAPYQAGNGPTIDGTITGAEWTKSTTYNLTFSFNGTENQIIRASLYLLHNGSALFIGLNITQGGIHTTPGDAFIIYFDENNNGILNGNATRPNEAGANLTRDGTFTDLSYNNVTWIDDLSVENLTKGPSNGATNGIGIWEFVFVSSYDDVKHRAKDTSDFDVNLPSNVLELPKTIRFDIEYYDANLTQMDSLVTTLNGTEALNPADWDLLVAGIVPMNDPNLLAIWGFIALVMILPAAVVAYLLIWIIRRKTDKGT